MGYSEQRLENPMGFEVAVAPAVRDAQERFIEKKFADAGGYLPTIPFRDIEYLPVTCTHTMHCVNIIEGKGPGLHPELCDEHGHVDKDEVLKRCPSWRKPL